MHETEQIRRLLEDKLGACREGDVTARVSALESLASEVPDTADEDVPALKALGNPTRYRIVRLLEAADDELCVCEFAPLLEVSDSAISHALSDLRAAGLVTRRRDGNWRYYGTTALAEGLLAALDDARDSHE